MRIEGRCRVASFAFQGQALGRRSVDRDHDDEKDHAVGLSKSKVDNTKKSKTYLSSRSRAYFSGYDEAEESSSMESDDIDEEEEDEDDEDSSWS